MPILPFMLIVSNCDPQALETFVKFPSPFCAKLLVEKSIDASNPVRCPDFGKPVSQQKKTPRKCKDFTHNNPWPNVGPQDS